MNTIQKQSYKAPKIDTTVVNSWISGVVSALDDGRTPQDGLRSADNQILDQDGVIRPRPSLQKFGPQPVGTVLGRTFEFKQLDGLTSTNWLINLQKIKQSEEQTLSITGTPTGGTFTLTYSGQTTSAINYNASASDVQTALLALSNLDTDDVTCTGGSLPGTAVKIAFGGTLVDTDVGLITSTDSLTGGTSPATSITTTNKGGTVAYAYVAKPSDTTWTKCNGGENVTFSTTGSGRFFQIADKVIILNGVDTMCYFDITTVSNDSPTVVDYTAIDDVGQPTIANKGSTDVTTGTCPYTVYYAVTANSTIGETTGTYKSQTVNLQREQWDKTKNSLSITWTKVTDAQSYNIYCAVQANGDGTPTLDLIASNVSADNDTFVDDGSQPLQSLLEMPSTNSTAGPITSYGTTVNGRLWLWGKSDEPYKILYGGNYGHELDFTTGNGGGFISIGNGTTEIPAVLWNFRSGQGDPQIKVLTKGLSGSGKRYTIAPLTVTLGDFSTTTWSTSEDYGRTGTDSPDALVEHQNSSYYPSRDGFKTTGTKPQLQNLLSTDTVSDTITPDLATINWNAMNNCIGLSYEGRLYWCLPVSGSSTNNQIWVLDLQRNGAWMKPWSVPADDMFLVEDSEGYTHHVILQNNTFYEFSYNTHTSDDGTAFTGGGSTGLHYFSKDGRLWVRLIRVVLEVLRPQGVVNYTLYGFTNKKKLEPIGSASFDETATALGYGWNELSWNTGWNDFTAVPDITAKTSIDVPIKVNKDVRYISCSWSHTQPNTDYALSKMITESVSIGIKNLS